MNAIAEEKLRDSTLRVDTSDLCPSPKLRTPTFVLSPTVEYSSMAFGNTNSGGDNTDSSQELTDSVQYSSMRFGDKSLPIGAHSNSAESGKTDSSGGVTPPDSPVHYSAMAFNHPLSTDSRESDVESTGSSMSQSGSVQYSTMAFNRTEGPSRDDHIPGEHDSRPTQYSTMYHSDESEDDSSVPSLTSTSTSPKQSNEELEARSITPTIQSTPLGTRINYEAEQFQCRNSLKLPKKTSTEPNILRIIADTRTKTL